MIFKPKKKDRTLVKVIVAIIVVGGIAFAVTRAPQWLKKKTPLGGMVTSSGAPAPEAAAPAPPTPPDVAKAAELVAQGKVDDARAMLKPLAQGGDSAPQALVLLAQIEKKAGNAPEALKLAERAYKEFSASPDHPKAAAAYARALEDSGKEDEAVRLYEELIKNSPPEAAAPALTGLGRKAERVPDLVKAREFYQKAAAAARWDSPEWNEAVDALGRVNVTLIFSPQETPDSKKYSVERRDSITTMGNKLDIPQGMLMRANGITETTTLSLGQQLKYTPKAFHIVIERSKCRLFLLDKDSLFKCYRVGLGKPGHETALGSYKIGTKEKNPTWHKPGEGPIPPGDPRNQLGTRWMPLVPNQAGLPRDLGIHGTINPPTVGLYSSMGCARLVPEEIEELYDLVVRSTPVDIVETFTLGGEAASAPAAPAAGATS